MTTRTAATDATDQRDWQHVPRTETATARRAAWKVALITLVVIAPAMCWAVRTRDIALAAGWLVVGLVLAGWVAGDTPRPKWLPTPGPGALPPVLVLSGVASLLVLRGGSFPRCVIPFALAVAFPIISRWGHGAVDRVLGRFGRAVGHVVAAVLFTLLGLLVVVVPWVAQRILRRDPLHPDPRWIGRDRRNLQPNQPWAPAVHRRVVSPVRRLANALIAITVVAAVVLITPVGRSTVRSAMGSQSERKGFRLFAADLESDERTPIRDAVPPGVRTLQPGGDKPQVAMADATWFSDGRAGAAQGWALDPRNAWRPVNVHRLRDLHSDVLNIVNGERQSWEPPASSAPRLNVWMLGGSTTYGLNQRDEHTIASEFGRVAAEHGLNVEIHNKGQNGHLHWMEAERMAWDLTTEPKPDLVVFYDGVNETWEASTLNRFSTGDIPEMYDPTTIDAWHNATKGKLTAPPRPGDARLIGRTKGPILETAAQAYATVQRYERARRLSRATAAAYGIPVDYFWQPSRYSRPLVPTEPHWDTASENQARLGEQLILKYLPKDVINLTDSLRSTTEPLFTDDVHHNEKGARLIADAMFTKIEPQLQKLTAAKGTAS